MTTIKATCPTCGEVELTGGDVELRVCSIEALSYYAFRCPDCGDRVRKTADGHVVSLLVSGGVQVLCWNVPAEAVETHVGPALCYDDLLDFGLELGLVDDLARAAGARPLPTP